MWRFLKKLCGCDTTPTNTSPTNICSDSGLTTNDYTYTGPDLNCTNVKQGDSLTLAFQKISHFLCSREFTEQIIETITDNIEEYPEFITILNNSVDCDVILDCAFPTTTTSTTILTTTTTSTLLTTTTSTTIVEFCEGNVILNPTFDSSLINWIVPFDSSWEWSPDFGGTALFLGRGKAIGITQNSLVNGETYNLTFTFYNLGICGQITVVSGGNVYGPFTDPGVTVINQVIVADTSELSFIAVDPCELGFENNIYIDNVCVTLIPTTTTTTSSSTTIPPSTTTTSTTLGPCYSYIVIASKGTPCYVNYVDCAGVLQEEYINNGYFNFCAIGIPIVTGDFILHGGTELCTTSTTTTFPVCYEFTLQSTVLENIVFNYVACNGTPGVIVLNNNIATICAISVTPPTAPENKWNLFIGFEC